MKFRQLALLICLLLLGLCPRGAAAEPTAAEVQVARRLFEQATRDEEAGRWQAALQKLQDVAQIKVTPGVLFHMAVCEQNLGRYVEALNELGRSEELARARNDKSVLALVPERRAELEAKVAQLRVVLKGDTAEAEVLVDERKLSKPALESDIPLNPGTHRITVRRSRGPELVRKVALQPGQRRVEEFALSVASEPAPPVMVSIPEGRESSPAFKSYLAKHIVIYSSYALALAGVGTGVFLLRDASSHDDSARAARTEVARQVQILNEEGVTLTNQPCTIPYQAPALQDPCVQLRGAVEHRDDSEKLAVWSFAIAGVGALAGTAAIIFWPETKEENATLRVAPTWGGVVASGSF